MILVQFRVNNLELLPSGLRREDDSNGAAEAVSRASQIRGEQCLPATDTVSCAEFLGDLISAGYVLVDALKKVRYDNRSQKEYGVVRFTFVDQDHAETVPEWQGQKPVAEQELRKMAGDATWRVRAYLNPFFREGYTIGGVFCLAVNCEVRESLVDGSGKPVLRWRKDSKGDRIGDAPLPVEPKGFLRIADGDLCVKNA